MFSAVTGSTVGTSGRAQMPPMVQVGRAQWRSHGATGEAGNGRPPQIKNSMQSSRPRSINRGSFTHRKTRHRPAHQPAHLPQGPRGAPCLFSWGTLRACPLSAAPVCSGGQCYTPCVRVLPLSGHKTSCIVSAGAQYRAPTSREGTAMKLGPGPKGA